MACAGFLNTKTYSVRILLSLTEDLAIDGGLLEHIEDVDLSGDFDIKIRLHRVKIIEGIKKLKKDFTGQPRHEIDQGSDEQPVSDEAPETSIPIMQVS